MKNISTLDDHFIKLITLKSKNPRAYQIYHFIISYTGKNNYLMCSNDIFKERFKIGNPVIYLALKALEEEKLMHVIKSNSDEYYELKEHKNLITIGKNDLDSNIYKVREERC